MTFDSSQIFGILKMLVDENVFKSNPLIPVNFMEVMLLLNFLLFQDQNLYNPNFIIIIDNLNNKNYTDFSLGESGKKIASLLMRVFLKKSFMSLFKTNKLSFITTKV